MSLLSQLLKEATNKENLQQVQANKEELAFNRQVALLPATFDVLRSIFGDKGPCLKTKDEVSAVRVAPTQDLLL